MPGILKAFAIREPVLISNSEAVHHSQHVLEPLRGYLTLAEQLLSDGTSCAEELNFGPREVDAQPVNYVVRQLAAKGGGLCQVAGEWREPSARSIHAAARRAQGCATIGLATHIHFECHASDDSCLDERLPRRKRSSKIDARANH